MAADGDGDGGLDFDIAMTACCIITDTPWDRGYFAQRAAAAAEAEDPVLQRVDRPQDGLLRHLDYFFCVEGLELSVKYPVIPSFHHWRFPHGGGPNQVSTLPADLPPPWRDLQLPNFTPQPPTLNLKGTAAVKFRDITCRISAHANSLENAHLVPVSERLWFVSNKMER